MRLLTVTLAIFCTIVTASAQTIPQRVPQFSQFPSTIPFVSPATEAQQQPVGGSTVPSPKTSSHEGARPAAMTAKEKKRACELGGDNHPSWSRAEWQAFMRKCTTSKDCEFLAQFLAAQEKRRRGATPVGVFSFPRKSIESFFNVYPFLKKDDFPVGAEAGIAEVRGKGGINLLFVSYNVTFLRVYVDKGAGYKKATLDETETFVEGISRADGEVSLFFGGGGGRIGGAPPSREYTLRGETFERTEPHEGCLRTDIKSL